MAAGTDSHDPVVGVDLLTAETEQLQVLGDSAHGTGQALAVLTEKGHEVLIKPWPTQPSSAYRADRSGPAQEPERACAPVVAPAALEEKTGTGAVIDVPEE